MENTLGGLLRSSEFPRWLMASALDVLIQDASADFTELPGGQCELAHEDGDFVVIDHNYADLCRPVVKDALKSSRRRHATGALKFAKCSVMPVDGHVGDQCRRPRKNSANSWRRPVISIG